MAALRDNGVGEAIDRGGDRQPPIATCVRRQVGATSTQLEAQGRPGYDDATASRRGAARC